MVGFQFLAMTSSGLCLCSEWLGWGEEQDHWEIGGQETERPGCWKDHLWIGEGIKNNGMCCHLGNKISRKGRKVI